MRIAITNALIEQEALALQMREELDEALRQAWPVITQAIVHSPPGERERILGEIVMAVTADIIQEHGANLEDSSEEQADAVVATVLKIAGDA